MPKLERSKLILVLILILGLIVSCGTKEENSSENSNDSQTLNKEKITAQKEIADTLYGDWDQFVYEGVVVFSPPDHMYLDNVQEMVVGFIKFRKQVCDYFMVPVPDETVYIYYYTGFGQLLDYTGKDYPSVDGSKIHFSMPFNLGAPMTEYVLNLWHPIEPQFNFVKQGIMALFDFSGQDYHEMTLNFVDEKILMSLEELVADTTINVYKEKYQSAESASFIAFILEHYHLEGLEKLYLSQDPFPKAVNKNFKTNINVLQNRWLEFAEKAYYRQLNN